MANFTLKIAAAAVLLVATLCAPSITGLEDAAARCKKGSCAKPSAIPECTTICETCFTACEKICPSPCPISFSNCEKDCADQAKTCLASCPLISDADGRRRCNDGCPTLKIGCDSACKRIRKCQGDCLNPATAT